MRGALVTCFIPPVTDSEFSRKSYQALLSNFSVLSGYIPPELGWSLHKLSNRYQRGFYGHNFKEKKMAKNKLILKKMWTVESNLRPGNYFFLETWHKSILIMLDVDRNWSDACTIRRPYMMPWFDWPQSSDCINFPPKGHTIDSPTKSILCRMVN